MGNLKGGFWSANTEFEPKAQFRFRIEIDGLEFEDAPGSKQATNKGDWGNDQRSDTAVAWYAKSVDKPGIELLSNVPTQDYFTLDGGSSAKIDINLDKPKLKPITMTLVDPTYPNVTRKLLRWIRRTGYNDSVVANALVTNNLTAQEALLKTIGHVRIYQLSSAMSTGVEIGRTTNFDIPGEAGVNITYERKPKILEVWTLYNAYPSTIDFGKLDYSSSDLVEITITWVYSNFTCDMVKLPDGMGDIEQAFTYFKDFAAFGGIDESKKPVTALTDCQKRFEDNGRFQTIKQWAKAKVSNNDPCIKYQYDLDDEDRIIVGSAEEAVATSEATGIKIDEFVIKAN